jgi:hypothetical protein
MSTVTDARAAAHLAIDALDDADVAKVARLLALGSEATIRERLRAEPDLERPGQQHPLTPTSAAAWVDGLALQLWMAIAPRRPGSRS